MNGVLRLLAWLLAIALVALPVVAVLEGWVGSERWPLSRLRVSGQFQHVPADQIRAALLPYARKGFFAVDLAGAQAALEKLPWVEHARVRKLWPDTLEVTVSEHRPFARWGTDRLLSEQGRLFAIPKNLDVSHLNLPQLGGPDARSAEVVAMYNESRALFAPVGVDVDRLQLDARGSWSLHLTSGTDVMIGRNDARARLNRFVRVLPQLLGRQPQAAPERADLRYTNGFTLNRGAQPRPSTSPAALATGPARTAQAQT